MSTQMPFSNLDVTRDRMRPVQMRRIGEQTIALKTKMIILDKSVF